MEQTSRILACSPTGLAVGYIRLLQSGVYDKVCGMSRSLEYESPELAARPARSSSQQLLGDLFDGATNNFLKPLANAAVLEPLATCANAINGSAKLVGAGDLVGTAKPFEVASAAPYSASWVLQNVSAGLGALVPYTIAGKVAGAAFRQTGATLGARGLAASVLKSEQAAFVAGAFAYDGLRPTHDGETHLGNSVAGAAAFGVFGLGNAVTGRFANLSDRVLARAATGFIGADVQAIVSAGVSRGKLPTREEAVEAGISGASMNIFLPAIQSAITRNIAARQMTRGGAWLDHYLNYSGLEENVARSPELQRLVQANPFAKVKVAEQRADVVVRAGRIELPAGRKDAGTLGRELSNLHSARTEARSFDSAADLLYRGQPEEAWQTFRQLRNAQVSEAHNSQNLINHDLNGTDVLPKQHLTYEMGAWPAPGGVSYEQRWRQEFHQFMQSGGKWRPGKPVLEDGHYTPESARDRLPQKESFTPEEQKAIRDRGIATDIVKTLQKAGYIALFAGGCVRDEMMGRLPKDYDVATSAPPDVVHRLFQQQGWKVAEVGKSFGIVNLSYDAQTQFEIASLRNDGNYSDGRRPDYVKFVASLFEDSARRDLTINAMFKDPVTNTTYDFFGGQKDIRDGVIRAVGDPEQRFAEDKLRMMRVPRFAARYGFSVDPGTRTAIANHAHEIGNLPPERITPELAGMLETAHPVTGLDFMMETGMMKAVLPEVIDLTGPRSAQDPRWHPEGNVWTHTRLVLNNLARIRRQLPGTSGYQLMFAGLLHDIGKPATQKIWEDGGISNAGHAQVGAQMAKEIGQRLKWSNADQDHVVHLVEHHMDMHHIDEVRRGKLVATLSHPLIEDMKALQHADSTGTAMPDAESKSRLKFIEEQQRLLREQITAKPIVDGQMLMTMGMKQSVRLGEIKKAAFEAQREGTIADRESARRWLLDHYSDFPPSAATVSLDPPAEKPKS